MPSRMPSRRPSQRPSQGPLAGSIHAFPVNRSGGGGNSGSSLRKYIPGNARVYYDEKNSRSGEHINELLAYGKPRKEKDPDIQKMKIYRKMMKDKQKAAVKFEKLKNRRATQKYIYKLAKKEIKAATKQPIKIAGWPIQLGHKKHRKHH
ncbi:hypothetical protein PG994_007935 [Apiospora phragmitis]|uniref:Uncharacterized protein n=1 Tax=Apiospora phragmitis TaxID=2905665 RepID=A0ABR1URM5_9PEZI